MVGANFYNKIIKKINKWPRENLVKGNVNLVKGKRNQGNVVVREKRNLDESQERGSLRRGKRNLDESQERGSLKRGKKEKRNQDVSQGRRNLKNPKSLRRGKRDRRKQRKR
jgi:hypothetical protein